MIPPLGESPAVTLSKRFLLYLTLGLLSILFMLPFVWMIKTSLMTAQQATTAPPEWIPHPFRFDNYVVATKAIPFWLYTRNTLYVAIMNVIGMTLASAFIAWGFAHYRFPGRDKFFAITLATMMVPFPVLMVSQYAIFRDLGWIGTYKPLWVPAFFGHAYNIFLLRQFLLGVPRDLTDVARIDGCGELRIFLQIIIPLIRPALLVVALFSFMYHWNDFMAPLIYLTDEKQFTLALGLQSFQSRLGETAITHLMAATTLMVAPVIALFFLTQKTFIEGISLTGLKG
ncbi:carbohydrate ABC transporter permease [bacterium]|nr:carbohydrate ABC transporter permease [bacterium]